MLLIVSLYATVMFAWHCCRRLQRVVYEFEAALYQLVLYLADMLLVLCLCLKTQDAGVDIFAVGVALMIDTHHVGAKLREHLAYAEHLTGLVLQFYAHRAGAAALGKSTIDNAVEDGNVNVSAAYHADCLLAFHRHLIEHHGCHAGGTCSFCHHLLALDELQDGSADFVLADCDNLVYVLYFEQVSKVILPGCFTAMPSAMVETEGNASCL